MARWYRLLLVVRVRIPPESMREAREVEQDANAKRKGAGAATFELDDELDVLESVFNSFRRCCYCCRSFDRMRAPGRGLQAEPRA